MSPPWTGEIVLKKISDGGGGMDMEVGDEGEADEGEEEKEKTKWCGNRWC